MLATCMIEWRVDLLARERGVVRAILTVGTVFALAAGMFVCEYAVDIAQLITYS